MSEIITGPMNSALQDEFLKNNAPNFTKPGETEKWLQGKISRADVIVLVGNVKEELEKQKTEIGTIINNIATQLSQTAQLTRMLGLQLETILRIADNGDNVMRNKFREEFVRTVKFVEFLDSLNPGGEHHEKPMKEKIALVLEWNKGEGNIVLDKDYLGLQQYMQAHLSEFTLEEIHTYSQQFNFAVEPVAIPCDNASVGDTLNVTSSSV